MREHTDTTNKTSVVRHYQFNAYLVAGHTPMEKNNAFDETINRPNGMQGYIINLTTKGKGTVFKDQEAFNCHSGDLLLFSPHASHYYHRADDAEQWHHQWIYFRPRALWTDWLIWTDTINHVGRLTVTDTSLHQEILNLFCQIEREYNSENPFSQEISMCLLELLLIKCFQLDPLNKKRKLDPRILDTCHFITENIRQNHSIAEIAENVHMSPSRLSHLFARQIGKGIIKWREEQRMMKAQHLLHTSGAPIYHIARQLGYDDPHYFSRLFKRYSGMDPTTYRNSR